MSDILGRIEAERAARAEDPLRPANPLLREAADEIAWLRSSLITLLSLAEAGSPNLTHKEVAVICRHTLNKFSRAALGE